MVDFIGFIANITSLVLWIPQARTTYANRKDKEALKGISYGTQIIASVNTIFWCVYGVMIHSVWLAMGTVIILPLALWTIWLKYSIDNDVLYELNYELSSRKISSKNELIETDRKGYFSLYMGNKVLCDHQGQHKLLKLENTTKIEVCCQKYHIDSITFNPKHYNDHN
ncbi:hypothetical protein LMK05_07215 [Lactococcus petauri]|nr:hypothetical protein LMK05_07215 [Lactococcus petauri]